MSDDETAGGVTGNPNRLLEASFAAREGDATRTLEALCAEFEERVELHATQLNHTDLDDPQANYMKGRLDESRSVATVARTVWLALKEGEDIPEGGFEDALDQLEADDE